MMSMPNNGRRENKADLMLVGRGAPPPKYGAPDDINKVVSLPVMMGRKFEEGETIL